MNRFFPQIRSRACRVVLAVVAVSLLVLGTGMVGAGGYRSWHWVKWKAEWVRIDEFVDSWKQGARPSGVKLDTWEYFIGMFYTTMGNGTQFDDTSLAQLRQIRAACEAIDKDSIIADTFDGLYGRVYEHVGPKGKKWLGKGHSGRVTYDDSRRWIRPVQPAAP
jgi:hypothetical protein